MNTGNLLLEANEKSLALFLFIVRFWTALALFFFLIKQ